MVNGTQEKTFDPTRYIIKLKGKDYIEVKWRLLWLRTQEPLAQIATELVQLDYRTVEKTVQKGTKQETETTISPIAYAVFKATVTLPSGASATGYGSEEKGDFGDFLEKAETKALGRALAALGFGTQFGDDYDFGGETGKVVDAPVNQPAPFTGFGSS